MSVSIDNYCKNPSLYSKKLTTNQKTFYDNICNTRKQLNLNWSKLGTSVASFPADMLNSMLSPEGLKMLSIFMGIDLSGKIAMSAILRTISTSVGEEVMKTASALATEKGSFFISNSLLTSVLSEAVEEGSIASKALMVTEMISEGAGEIMGILTIVQFLGAIFDSWDPNGYGNELNAESLDIINNQFNIKFMQKFLSTVSAGNDEFGNPIFYSSWPVEYYADPIIANEKKNIYQKKFFEYTTEYLQNLTVNSNGETIYWGPIDSDHNIITPNWFENYAKKYSDVLADKNTVVSNWINKYLLLILVIFVITILFLLFIK